MSMQKNNVPVVDGVEEPVKKPSTAQRVIGIVVNVVLVLAIVLAVMASALRNFNFSALKKRNNQVEVTK